MFDYLSLIKDIESALEEGLLEEIYVNGELKYRLTNKGLKYAKNLVKKDPEYFELMLKVIIGEACEVKKVLEFLLFFIYVYVYDMSEEEAVKRAKSWFI